jgi:SPP1 family predicted phage head-tail adaptor
VLIQQPTETVDDAGQVISTWADVVTLDCAVDAVSATEQMVADQKTNPVIYRFVARYDSRVMPTMRAVFDGNAYDILGLVPLDNHLVFMRLECTRVL